jgi:hypothetical protein
MRLGEDEAKDFSNDTLGVPMHRTWTSAHKHRVACAADNASGNRQESLKSSKIESVPGVRCPMTGPRTAFLDSSNQAKVICSNVITPHNVAWIEQT